MKFFLYLWIFIPLSYADVFPIAHRGASAYAPENTISSVKKAIELGSNYIEIDVHMTKDREVVAIHDSTIDRTSNGHGKVLDYNLTELKKFDFGSWFESDFSQKKIPTLREIFQVISADSILIIELKDGSDIYPQIEHKIISLIKEFHFEQRVIVKSFSYKILNTFYKIAPKIKRLYCTLGGNSWITIDNFLRFKSIFEGSTFEYLQVHKYFLSDWIIKEAHARGIKVIVWDVHDKKSMEKFLAKGVDFIESDKPDYVLDIMRLK